MIAEEGIETIVHFAASIVVPDSVHDPLGYYSNNTVNSHALIETAVTACRASPARSFEPVRAQLGVAHRVLDAVVADPSCRFGATSSRRTATSPMLIVPFELPAWLACALGSVELS